MSRIHFVLRSETPAGVWGCGFVCNRECLGFADIVRSYIHCALAGA
jgi:hypothetical protein